MIEAVGIDKIAFLICYIIFGFSCYGIIRNEHNSYEDLVVYARYSVISIIALLIIIYFSENILRIIHGFILLLILVPFILKFFYIITMYGRRNEWTFGQSTFETVIGYLNQTSCGNEVVLSNENSLVKIKGYQSSKINWDQITQIKAEDNESISVDYTILYFGYGDDQWFMVSDMAIGFKDVNQMMIKKFPSISENWQNYSHHQMGKIIQLYHWKENVF